MNERQNPAAEPDRIEAKQVTLEIVDEMTGQRFRRQLPLHYLENDNGVVLTGEDYQGTPAQIHFLSEAAVAKLRELMGRGPDAPRCGDHEEPEMGVE
ncbi:MAG TPA: hypothetical protein VN611_10835 [Patescibacteria group bacterium]|nr:hypothetical protein [Patescibacteria group bacterium]